MKDLRLLRIKKGLTQTELAERSGLTQPRISQLECGLKPNDNDRKRIIKAFGLDDESQP